MDALDVVHQGIGNDVEMYMPLGSERVALSTRPSESPARFFASRFSRFKSRSHMHKTENRASKRGLADRNAQRPGNAGKQRRGHGLPFKPKLNCQISQKPANCPISLSPLAKIARVATCHAASQSAGRLSERAREKDGTQARRRSQFSQFFPSFAKRLQI